MLTGPAIYVTFHEGHLQPCRSISRTRAKRLKRKLFADDGDTHKKYSISCMLQYMHAHNWLCALLLGNHVAIGVRRRM